jgi:hypothetical protein
MIDRIICMSDVDISMLAGGAPCIDELRYIDTQWVRRRSVAYCPVTELS